MIPILYEKTETEFESNGLGRLRDCTSAIVTEERNGVYELDFDYPVDGAHFDEIQLGRIVGVEHDETNDVQPFDIVSYSRPIDGVVSFHCQHISYRQSKMTVSCENINSLSDAFTALSGASPDNPFTYWTDKTSTGYMAAADGTPYSVRQLLGGVEGSILDAYGGEYEWDRFTVKLWASRGTDRYLTIRYGVNMLDYTDETNDTETCNAIVPYWKGADALGGDIVVKGSMVESGMASTTGRIECIPIDFTDKFESQPTVAQLEAMARSYMNSNQTYSPAKTISVDFIRLADSPEYTKFAKLQECKLCDTVRVEFPRYNMSGRFKIVKTEYDVLLERFTNLELGKLSTTLAEALGVGNSSGGGSGSGGFNIDLIYPVGSYYETSDTTFDPNVAWGGTWVSENGVIHPTGGTQRLSARNTATATSTDSTNGHTICSFDYTTKTGRIFLHADAAWFTSRNTARIELREDGVPLTSSTTNSTSLQRGVITFERTVTAGSTHTYSLHLIPQSGATATLPAYQTFTLYCHDLAAIDSNKIVWHRTA